MSVGSDFTCFHIPSFFFLDGVVIRVCKTAGCVLQA